MAKVNAAVLPLGVVIAAEAALKAMPRLSILLPTVENRKDLFAKLHAELKRQSEGKRVELLTACDAKQISIGRKRQNLLEAATGDYVVFVDDDDWIATDYVDRILAALSESPDCVGFKIECSVNGQRDGMAAASMRYKHWGENEDGYKYTRSTYHKTPVKRSIALKAGFPDLRFGEDRVYSERVMKLVETEVFISHVMYYYRYAKENFNRKYGFKPKRDWPTEKGINYGHRRRPFQH